jgi:hypothetical protein
MFEAQAGSPTNGPENRTHNPDTRSSAARQWVIKHMAVAQNPGKPARV